MWSRDLTRGEINQGIVNIEVGCALLQPAEFVMTRLQFAADSHP